MSLLGKTAMKRRRSSHQEHILIRLTGRFALPISGSTSTPEIHAVFIPDRISESIR